MDDINRNEDEIKKYQEIKNKKEEYEEEEEEEDEEEEEEEEEEVFEEKDLGDNLKIDDEKMNKLKEKGKNATCKIQLPKHNGSGFFCIIQDNGNTIKVLLTNNHILNEDSLKKGNRIKNYISR